MKKMKTMVMFVAACAPIAVAMTSVSAQQFSYVKWSVNSTKRFSSKSDSTELIIRDMFDLLVDESEDRSDFHSIDLTMIAGSESSMIHKFDTSSPGIVDSSRLYAMDINPEWIHGHSTTMVLSHNFPESIQDISMVKFEGNKMVVPDNSSMKAVLPTIGGLMILGFAGLLALRWPIGASL